MADPRLKQIKIKTGVVTRITKEKQSYEKETVNEKERLLKFKNKGNKIKHSPFR
jgi:tubulin-specific chaperone A